MHATSIKKIHSRLSESENILLITHDDPDVDAVGSIYAFSEYMEKHGMRHTIFFREESTELYSFTASMKQPLGKEALKSEYDTIVIFDSSDLRHTGIEDFLKNLPDKTVLINIDHHKTNVFYGHINLVMIDAVSTTEILYDYFTHLKKDITLPIARLILCGILGDTNNFTNHNTTPKSIGISSELLKTGIRIPQILKELRRVRTVSDLNAWGKTLEKIKRNEKHNIAYSVIAKDDWHGAKNEEAFSGLSNFLNNINGVEFSVLIRELPGNQLKISMRSNSNLIDLAKFAKMFNGGGHKKAAGFSISGQLKKTENGWRIT